MSSFHRDAADREVMAVSHEKVDDLYRQIEELRALTIRQKAETILLFGDRDSALYEIRKLKRLLISALPTIQVRARVDGDSSLRVLSESIRAALRE